MRYYDENETSSYEVNLPDENDVPLDTGGEQRLKQILNYFRQ
jgi:predicted metal-dependent peptidase